MSYNEATKCIHQDARSPRLHSESFSTALHGIGSCVSLMGRDACFLPSLFAEWAPLTAGKVGRDHSKYVCMYVAKAC